MMKEKNYSMNETWDVVEGNRRAKEAIASELSQLIERQRELDTSVAAAVDTGDVDAIRKLRAEREDLEAKILVTRAKLSKPDRQPDIVGGFRKYAEAYNEAFRAKLTEYIAARDALFQQYMSLLEMQDKALQEQKKCDVYLSGNYGLPGFIRVNGLKVLELLPEGDKVIYHNCYYAPEVAFFTALGYLNQDMSYKANNIHFVHEAGYLPESE